MRVQRWGLRTARIFTASRQRSFGCRPLRNPTNSNTMPQMDGFTLDTPSPPLTHSPSSKPEATLPKFGSALLHRTPWTPPTAVRANGINIELDDGSQVIDAVGGAAVSCLGMGNQRVMDAITSQMGNFACKSIHVLILFGCDTEQRNALADRPKVIQASKRKPPWVGPETSYLGNIVSLCSLFAENPPFHNLSICLD